jgi:hypothetical protein
VDITRSVWLPGVCSVRAPAAGHFSLSADHLEIFSMTRLHLVSIIAINTFALALTVGTAEAQVKPFKISGSGVGPLGLPLPGQDPRPHWIIGEATDLGRHYGEGTVQTDSAEFDPATGKIVGEFGSGDPFVFTAANGDQLVCYYGRTDKGAAQPGSFELTIVDVTDTGAFVVNAKWIAEFVPQPGLCTGRFAGVTGSWVMYAKTDKPFLLGTDDPVFYSWVGSGQLTFANRQ